MIREVMGASMDLIDPRAIYMHSIVRKNHCSRAFGKFKDDLEKARQLRDEKGYPIKRFVFITPEALREPDQRIIRDCARETGFDDGISMSAEHLEVLLARNMEIVPQFPELSYPKIEQKLDRVLNIVEQMQRSQESVPRTQLTSKITGTAAQILMLAVKAANKAIAGMAEAEEIIRILDLTNPIQGRRRGT
jgi:hypothetical protein